MSMRYILQIQYGLSVPRPNNDYIILPPDITDFAAVSSGRSLLLSSCDTYSDTSFFTSASGANKKRDFCSIIL